MKKKQFGEFLGEFQSLPHEVSIMNYVSSRAHEISAMTSSIENPKQTKLIFQKLPVYMRRRVMSHNAKRLPRRLREAHLAQMVKSGNGKDLPSINKRLSRKYRRRPRNLLSEYNRRQRDKLWLETHIWHAKRFYMIDKWGYRIASHSNDKSFRANYRAATKYCLLQDISYYTCIEITGEEKLLKTTLITHCNTSMLTFTAKKYINGHREGTLMFYKKNGYPQFPIGNVDFFWQPNKSDIQTNVRTIWIWVHPAFYDDFLNEIISSFEFKQNNVEQEVASTIHNLNCLYTNNVGCTMIILRNALNRFRLRGALTLNVLTKALQLPSLNKLDFCTDYTILKDNDDSLRNKMIDTSITSDNVQSTEKKVIDKINEDITISKYLNTELGKNAWYINYYKKKENKEAFKVQEQLWQILMSLGSSNYLPANMIIGVTILDPRFYLSEKRTKCNTEITETFSRSILVDRLVTNSNYSPIWDTEIRHIVSSSCMPTNIINKLRSECLVPGVSNDQYYTEDIMAKIPILLIQKPGTITGLGSGIDVIIPARWAMPFWLAFLMQCARAGGLQESRSIAFESLNPNTPDVNDPDSPAYMREALITKEQLTKKYFRYPPNRRINFVKFGIRSPFFCDWKNLMKNWSGNEDFYVLRNREILLLLQAGICPAKNKNAKFLFQNTSSSFPNLDDYKNCLIHVHVSIMGKGSPKKFAIICMPTFEDLNKIKTNKKWFGPVEKCHNDPNEKIRKALRKNHLILLKRLRRQRVRRKQVLKNNALKLLKESDKLNENEHIIVSSHRKIISDQLIKMSELYLPKCAEVRYSCDREVMGYITLGDFSFSQAKGIGIGYITLISLLGMINKKSNIVLVRNPQTRQYRLAELNILV
ncbi:PREDICTED: ribonucleases P/MRP protein subunit POP1 [Trachymyrmex septentrionalis]|uniref:ribonucleases P/MRP protein subunit POP1 n=1 Tax=Trachymyrmex septentrionalis TaxID=34720 RepID=UPI00084F810D|nr:PREDICTED: ribonucleases P/MRP protein subunit POP1 [Trachymyrmex septentrionalis]XP_018352598.1 PREDICTED: ribonucleases P/MRP protein subunit POP1 [Trachymyrmex septentrionalis]